ncbi:methyltransferase [Candidatus Woesebacteria bacterium]|nr:methyltransferase [Candidatus Woesebacteria bacterium]
MTYEKPVLTYLSKLELEHDSNVNDSDYYSDLLLQSLFNFLKKNNFNSIKRVLEIGTGRGYISLVLPNLIPSIEQIIATDVDHYAILLATQNVQLNRLGHKISIRTGSLFEPVEREQPFDLIIAVPPQLPLSKSQIKTLLNSSDTYHIHTSSGGESGRMLVDQIIASSYRFLSPVGMLVIAHSDIIGFEKTEDLMRRNGLVPQLIGSKAKLLKETTLTRLGKPIFESGGYSFRQNDFGEEYFNVGVFLGKKQN